MYVMVVRKVVSRAGGIRPARSRFIVMPDDDSFAGAPYTTKPARPQGDVS